MKVPFQIFLLATICTVSFSELTPSILTKTIHVLEENDFTNYIYFDSKQELISCSLQYKNSNGTAITIPIYPETRAVYDSDTLDGRIKSVGNGTCGLIFYKFKREDPREYQIFSDYKEQGAPNNKTFKFEIKPHFLSDEKNQSQILRIGKTAYIDCFLRSQSSCKVYDPKGILKYSTSDQKACLYLIPMVTMEHIGKWKCTHILPGTMLTTTHYVDTELESSTVESISETWYIEEGDFAKIGCKSNSKISTGIPKDCMLITPKGDDLIINPGFRTDRYTTHGTNLTGIQCQIEIKLPLLESEKGPWKCRIDDAGGFNYTDSKIPEFSKYAKRGMDNSSYSELQQFELKFNVPYTSEHAYIQSPTGELFECGSESNLKLGECILKYNSISKENMSYIGNWTCFFSRFDNALDDVLVMEIWDTTEVHTRTKEIEADAGGSAELLCNTNLPISYCRFVDPLGHKYHVSPKKEGNGMKYIGRGLEYGDCGIEISKLDSEHQGTWSCNVLHGTSGNIDKSRKEYSAKIGVVVVSPTGGINQASAIGIPIGIMAAALIILSLAMFKRYSKRSNNRVIPNRPSNGSGSSENSETVISAF